MSIKARLKTLERTAEESEPAPLECVTVATIMGDLQIPASLLPMIDKVYGGGSSVMPDERF